MYLKGKKTQDGDFPPAGLFAKCLQQLTQVKAESPGLNPGLPHREQGPN